nr:3-hydroxyacyl-CoA dehydrogenase NAD-binding domain-containing protein [uncultured Gellertiella sp.]
MAGSETERHVFSPEVCARVMEGVLEIVLDNPPVNAASLGLRQGLAAALDFALATDGVRAVVLTGTGKSFVGGADIREFGKPPAEPILPALVERIEAFGKPVVAAINGVALGGGLELALACHFRIASPFARLGLPEVRLGLVPGAGGTQRLPRLTGLPDAIEMIGTGRIIGADEAYGLGILDARTQGDLLQAARSSALALVGEVLRRTGARPVASAALDDIDRAEKKVLARARRQVAPVEATRLVRASAHVPLAQGLAEERRTFLALKDSPQAKALRHVFFAERAAAKGEGLEGVSPRRLEMIGIAGTGLMGSGIAVSALDAGFHVVAVDRSPEAATAGRARIETILKRNLASGRIDEAGLQARLQRLEVSHRNEALSGCDLVIEAVFDDMEVKAALFADLDRIVRPDAVLATNTSYLDPDRLAAGTRDPARVVGLHFFSPAHVMRLCEVVKGAKTAPDVLATGLAFARRLGKLAITCGVTEGFIGNRIFSAYRRQAEFLVEDGASPADIDRAMEDFGMAMGPFAVFDLAGLDIAWARRKRQAASRDPDARYSPLADRLCEAGRFGQKAGKGWYAHVDGKRQDDPEVSALIDAVRAEKGITPHRIDAETIVRTLVAAMAGEGRALLEEGIAFRAGDIDLVMINGYGFPAHRGGPMFLAETEKERSDG